MRHRGRIFIIHDTAPLAVLPHSSLMTLECAYTRTPLMWYTVVCLSEAFCAVRPGSGDEHVQQ